MITTLAKKVKTSCEARKGSGFLKFSKKDFVTSKKGEVKKSKRKERIKKVTAKGSNIISPVIKDFFIFSPF